MNIFDDANVDESAFSYRDLLDLDAWDTFVPVFTSLTVVGATSYSGRFRIIGRGCFFQVKLSAATSIASTAGTTYMTLPVAAQGLAGEGSMQNQTTNVAVGACVINGSKCYLPTQAASANVFTLSGWFEI